MPFFVPPLQKAVDGYGIKVAYKHNLKAIDGPAKTALFSVTDADGNVSDVDKRFDMIHVVPPQTGLDVVRASPLANAAGWIEVDPANLRHVHYPNIFALGDAASTPNSKTAAAVRIQAPIVVANLLAAMQGAPLPKAYDGFGSCPLTVAYGKVVLAEFTYGGKVTPSFPLDPRVPRRSMWLLKTAASLALLVSHVQGQRVRHPSPRERLVTLPRVRPIRPDALAFDTAEYAATKTAAPAKQCRSNPISCRRLLKTGKFQMPAGDYRRFRNWMAFYLFFYQSVSGLREC